MKGASTSNQTGVYGTRGISSVSNTPGARSGGCTWTDYSGALWLFGGENSNSQRFNDLWKYDRVSGRWTWMKGASTSNQTGVYGTLGTPAAANTPGARKLATSWIDTFGNMWLFGGLAYDRNGNYGPINDLWKYDALSGNWTWMDGVSTIQQMGTYGTRGVPAAANMPGARGGAASWTDPSGGQWLFGGNGYAVAGAAGFLNDLWKYDPATGNWTWMKGVWSTGQSGVYGTLGTPDAANTPGARNRSVAWTGLSGELWLFGGSDYDVTGGGLLNDLWKYDPVTDNWTWMKGGSTANQLGVYGTLGIQAAENTPGARDQAVSWADPSGALWLFGGIGYPGSGSSGYLSDLWKYDPLTGNWAWIKGPSTYNQSGVYGTRGTPTDTNTPGARLNAVPWADTSGAMWLFGGFGTDGASSSGSLNDLWRAAGPMDTASPIITRLGANPVTFTAGCQASYADAGATAVDAYGVDLTGSIVVTNPVNVAVPGSYTVRYNVTDSRGNRAREITRTVKMLEMPPPVITRLGNATITVTCPASYSDPGATAVDACGNVLTGSIAVTNPVNVTTPGVYTVRYGVTDSKGNSAVEVTRTVNVVDTGSPVITRLGSATITVECHSIYRYTDAGATATDFCAGDITGRISVSDPVNVNVNVPGSYIVRYNVNDGNGNSAVEVTRTVNVVDTTPPVIALVGSAMVTVECHTAYTDAGATATDSCAGDITGRIGISNPVNVNVPGSYTVRYNVNDGNGNTGDEATRTVNVVDTTTPVITRLGAAAITVEWGTEYADAGATASDTCQGDLTANIVTVNPVNTAVVGVYTVKYNVVDGNGNSAVEVRRTVMVGSSICRVNAANTTGPHDGKSWATAFRDIQSAENAASTVGGEVWVAAGTYTGTDDPVVTMKPGVFLYGGFAGTESSSADRNWSANVTVIDGENARRCVNGAANATLDGFTVTRGQSVNGGGMYNNSPLTVVNCTFTNNTATYDSGGYGGGGAMCNDGSSPAVTNCVFAHNTAVKCGGAMYNVSPASPAVMNCTFTLNTATSGGALFNYSGASPLLTNCILWGDAATTGPEINDDPPSASVVTYSCAQGAPAGTGNISADPLFVDAGAGNLQIQACTSPCVDKGTAAAAPGSDIRGMARPQGGGVDMGAYETPADTIAPVIELNGASQVSADCGATYTDTGATVTDNCATGLAVTVGGDTVSTAFLGAVYTVTYNANDGRGNSAVEVKRTVTVVDTTPPLITLRGGATVAVECHGSYTDPGAAADDACAGDLPVSVGSDVVDTSVLGVYTVTYNANDGNGNNAIEAIRTVNVVDTAKPVITLLGEPVVTLNCGQEYTDAGVTAADTCWGQLTDNIITSGMPPAGPLVPGAWTVSYDVRDGSGNFADTAWRTVTVHDNCTLTVEAVEDTRVDCTLGRRVQISVAVAGAVGQPKYQWKKRSASQGGNDYEILRDNTESSLVIDPVTADAAGFYMCSVSDAVTTVNGPVFTLALPAKTVPVLGLFGFGVIVAALGLGGTSTLRRRKR
jgi:N-acetylneuraminic acid mutarotase